MFEENLCFRDGLVWTVDLTGEINLHFSDGLVWTVGLTVEIKLRFRNGLMWRVGLTKETKLRDTFFAVVWTGPDICRGLNANGIKIPYDKHHKNNNNIYLYQKRSTDESNT